MILVNLMVNNDITSKVVRCRLRSKSSILTCYLAKTQCDKPIACEMRSYYSQGNIISMIAVDTIQAKISHINNA